MNVRFNKEDRQYFTMAEAPIVNAIIKNMKSSDDDVNTITECAMHALDEYGVEVLKADAKISHNDRIYNYYNNESGTIDIWVDAIVKTDNTFYIIGFYLSDAWSISCDNHAEIASHMYVRKFVEAK